MLIGLIRATSGIGNTIQLLIAATRLPRVLAELVDNIMPRHAEQPRAWIIEDHTIAPRDEVAQRCLLQRVISRICAARNTSRILQKRRCGGSGIARESCAIVGPPGETASENAQLRALKNRHSCVLDLI